MDADGTRDGFDLEMISVFRQELSLPLIASGGAGKIEDFPRAVEAGADAVLAASVFHFGTVSIDAAKRSIAAAGQIVRLPFQG
jgi:cyclase